MHRPSFPRSHGPRVTFLLTGLLLLALLTATLNAGSASAQWAEQWWFGSYEISQAQAVSNGSGVIVAVVDTGVVSSSVVAGTPTVIGDLVGQVLPGKDFTASGGAGVDPGTGCDQTGGCYSHGTQMALLIAGTGQGAGMEGVAPGAKILPVKAGAGTGKPLSPANVAAAIDWAVANRATVINLSFGGPGACDPTVGAAIKRAYEHDVIVVASTGDDGSSVESPADCPGAIAVGAVDQHGVVWSSSATGPEVDFVNAGVDGVQETLSQQKLAQGVDGTSDATAITSGMFALLRAKFPTETARQIVTRALWHTENGMPEPARRINDSIGYGQLLPLNALTKPTPANAANPIYDGFDRAFGKKSPAPTHSATPKASAGKRTTGDLVVAVAGTAVVLVAGVSAFVVLTRGRRRRPGRSPGRRRRT